MSSISFHVENISADNLKFIILWRRVPFALLIKAPDSILCVLLEERKKIQFTRADKQDYERAHVVSRYVKMSPLGFALFENHTGVRKWGRECKLIQIHNNHLHI
jgi:hypothetical protein